MNIFKLLVTVHFIFITTGALCQTQLQQGAWRAAVLRADSNNIVFNLQVVYKSAKPVFTIQNGDEKISITDVLVNKDSMILKLPVFESLFRIRIINKKLITGKWVKINATQTTEVPFIAEAGKPERFETMGQKPSLDISGKWAMQFVNNKNETEKAIGEFHQKGEQLYGSILTTTGDDRFLAGVVKGDSLFLSTFDGIHAMLFTAKIETKDSITNGNYYSGAAGKESFSAIKNDTATLPDESAMFLKDSAHRKLSFAFMDIDGKKVSINDACFKNKVVVIQIMGSWCPNCMDETKFLSDWYKQNKTRGVEVIALAYELSENFKRSQTDLRKFQKKFDVKYPMLITGVTVIDPQRTEKTLPQLTQIKMFPTSIIIDKTGAVRKIDTGFYGPGTSSYYDEFKQVFNKEIDTLLNESSSNATF